MTFKEYSEEAYASAIYPKDYDKVYPALGLCGEAGEVAEKVKKEIRDFTDHSQAIKKEIGDVLWYLNALCYDYNYTLAEAAQDNLTKLRDRRERGVLRGSGDNR
jgi:NTP pyrophosphatase (non-canonical NTP hydrolase)